MTIDATFWVAISFLIFFIGLIYLKVPQKVNNSLDEKIKQIHDEIGRNREESNKNDNFNLILYLMR